MKDGAEEKEENRDAEGEEKEGKRQEEDNDTAHDPGGKFRTEERMRGRL